MRLTCPNCGAQYEVPDEVIPFDGRDVQCSNCGDTWFQGHPDNPETVMEPDADAVDSVPEAGADPVEQPIPEDTPAPERPRPDENSAIDSGITDILRQEAEREVHLRASETGDPLESQPDLGLDNVTGDAPTQRAKESRDRMARMRGEAADAGAGAGPRSELLPDIEDINATWKGSDEGALANTALGPVEADQQQKKRNGFSRGFALILAAGVILALLYSNAAKIAGAIPVAAPMLDSYVAAVDQARVWLDARLGDMVPKPDE